MTIADNDIIAGMRRQPEQGFRLLMRKYREPVYWHIRRLVVTHADAQDAATHRLPHGYIALPQTRPYASSADVTTA